MGEVARLRTGRPALDSVFDRVLPCDRCEQVPPCPCSHGSREAADAAWARRLAVPPPSRPGVVAA